jgi:hypothetical protein
MFTLDSNFWVQGHRSIFNLEKKTKCDWPHLANLHAEWVERDTPTRPPICPALSEYVCCSPTQPPTPQLASARERERERIGALHLVVSELLSKRRTRSRAARVVWRRSRVRAPPACLQRQRFQHRTLPAARLHDSNIKALLRICIQINFGEHERWSRL